MNLSNRSCSRSLLTETGKAYRTETRGQDFSGTLLLGPHLDIVVGVDASIQVPEVFSTAMANVGAAGVDSGVKYALIYFAILLSSGDCGVEVDLMASRAALPRRRTKHFASRENAFKEMRCVDKSYKITFR